MSTDRLIGVISIILGLPSFLALFFSSEHRMQGALGVVIVLVVLVGAWLYKRQEDKPQFTSLELDKTYRILTQDGTKATAQRVERMRANFNNISEWWNRGLQFDGTISNLLIDGTPPDKTESKAGTLEVCRCFPRSLERGEEVTITMSYELQDAFTRNAESVVHINSTNVKELTITVELPRPCYHAEVRRTYSGDHGKLLDKPTLNSNQQIIVAKIRKPRMGASYHVDWRW